MPPPLRRSTTVPVLAGAGSSAASALPDGDDGGRRRRLVRPRRGRDPRHRRRVGFGQEHDRAPGSRARATRRRHRRVARQDRGLRRASRAAPRRRLISVVDQDPLSSFDPRWSVERILLDAVPRDVRGAARTERVRELLDQVGLAPDVLRRFPLRLSGGQRQRVAIARALAPRPAVIVWTRPSRPSTSPSRRRSSTCWSTAAATGVSYLFISHDLGVISHLSDRVLVMKDGVVVEHGDACRHLRTAAASVHQRAHRLDPPIRSPDDRKA